MGWLGTTIDGVYRAFAPRRWVMRQHWRKMASDERYRETMLATLRARGYRSAASEDRTPWLGGFTRSADAEITYDLRAMRRHSRELNRDDPLAAGLTKTFVTNVIGCGIRPQARTDDDEKNSAIEAVWRERQDDLHPQEDIGYFEAQRLKFRKVLEDGDVFVRKAYGAGQRGLWLEVIEADRLGFPIGVRVPEGHEIRDGVQKNSDGIRVGYWIRKYHPGDVYGSVSDGLGGRSSLIAFRANRVESFEASPADDVRHLRRIERPGQTRGVPLYHANSQDFRDLDLLFEASLKRSQVSACVAAFLKSEIPTDSLLDVTARKYGYVLDQAIEPGMIMKLYPGESLEQMAPKAVAPEFFPFIRSIATRIGVSAGLTWQTVLRDFSNANYSSARTDLLADRQTYRVWQDWFIHKCLAWEWFEVLRDARDMLGDPRLQGVTDTDLRAVHWIAPGWQWVDPQKEAQATQIKLESGMSTLRDELAAQGQDWEEVLRQQKREQDFRAELGLKVAQPEQPAEPTTSDRSRARIRRVNGHRRVA